MKIKQINSLMTFTIKMDNGECWMRHNGTSAVEPGEAICWMKQDGKNMIGVSYEDAERMERLFTELVRKEKSDLIERLKEQGFAVIEVDSVSKLDDPALREEIVAAIQTGGEKPIIH